MDMSSMANAWVDSYLEALVRGSAAAHGLFSSIADSMDDPLTDPDCAHPLPPHAPRMEPH